MYGSMKVLPYEQAFLDHMNLEAGKEPANLEDSYEAIDVQQDPWNFITGPSSPTGFVEDKLNLPP